MPESRAPANRDAAIAALAELLDVRLSLAEEIRAEHARDVSHHRPALPDAVAFPQDSEEVAGIVRICAEHRMPVIPFGTGTAVEGGVVAIRGGVAVDLGRMNRIHEINVADMDATVQAGVTRKQLNRRLAEEQTGLFFSVDPGADASLGGMAATNASGSAALRYGTMREKVLELQAVMPDGRIVRTGGRARKSSAGYDLTRLLVGSEGTLGLITEVTVRLTRLPEAVSAAVCPFPDVDSAVNAVIEVMSAGIPLARTELLDEVQMRAVNRYADLDYEDAPTLFFEFHGSPTGVVEQTEAVAQIVGRHCGGDFRWATEEAERDRLWQARHNAYYASLALRPGGLGYVTDVCVPVSQLAVCIDRTKRELESTRIPSPLFGHAGDGNFHVVFVIDPESEEELGEVRAVGRRILDHALELGGTCTGEHGIGLGKIDALEREHGEAIPVMRAIKQALDPHNIMNPGKVLRDS